MIEQSVPTPTPHKEISLWEGGILSELTLYQWLGWYCPKVFYKASTSFCGVVTRFSRDLTAEADPRILRSLPAPSNRVPWSLCSWHPEEYESWQRDFLFGLAKLGLQCSVAVMHWLTPMNQRTLTICYHKRAYPAERSCGRPGYRALSELIGSLGGKEMGVQCLIWEL